MSKVRTPLGDTITREKRIVRGGHIIEDITIETGVFKAPLDLEVLPEALELPREYTHRRERA